MQRRGAAGVRPLIERRDTGVGRRDADARRVERKLGGGDLAEHALHALADLRRAGEHGRATVLMKPHDRRRRRARSAAILHRAGETSALSGLAGRLPADLLRHRLERLIEVTVDLPVARRVLLVALQEILHAELNGSMPSRAAMMSI